MLYVIPAVIMNKNKTELVLIYGNVQHILKEHTK